MRTTLNIDVELLAEAQRLSGVGTKTAAVEQGLRALIAKHRRERLACLAGAHPEVEAPPRRRPRSVSK